MVYCVFSRSLSPPPFFVLCLTFIVGAVDDLSDYFSKQGVDIPRDVNPAERMIDIVSGDLSRGRDWNKVWLESEECEARFHELEQLKESCHGEQEAADDDHYEFASTFSMQLKLVTKRASIQVRDFYLFTGDN